MSELAQKLWEVYKQGYADILCCDVSDFNNLYDAAGKAVLANVIREAAKGILPDEVEQKLNVSPAWKQQLLHLADNLQNLP